MSFVRIQAGHRRCFKKWGISIQKQSGTVSESSRSSGSFGASASFWEGLVRKKIVFGDVDSRDSKENLKKMVCHRRFLGCRIPKLDRRTDGSAALGIRKPSSETHPKQKNTNFFRTKTSQKLGYTPNEPEDRELSETVPICF